MKKSIVVLMFTLGLATPFSAATAGDVIFNNAADAAAKGQAIAADRRSGGGGNTGGGGGGGGPIGAGGL